MVLLNDEPTQPTMREQIEGLVEYLDTWQHNTNIRTEQDVRTEFNRGAHWGQNEVLKVTLQRLRTILDETSAEKGTVSRV